MTISYQADNDLRKSIVRGVLRREPRINFKSAQAARLDGVSDFEVLSRGADDNRIVVSHDFQTMPAHFREFTKHRPSPGVFLLAQDLPIGEAIEVLILIWDASEAEEWVNRVCLLPSLVTIALAT